MITKLTHDEKETPILIMQAEYDKVKRINGIDTYRKHIHLILNKVYEMETSES